MRVGQAKADRKLGAAARRVRRQQRRSRPGHRQRTGKVEARPTLRIADQKVRDASPLGARQPCGDEGATRVDFGIDPERPAGEEHRHRRNAEVLVILERAQAGARVVKRQLHVTEHLGVRRLAEHHDRDVGLLGDEVVDLVQHLPTLREDRLLDAGRDRLRLRKIVLACVVALPAQGPAAVLHEQVVRMRTCDHDLRGATDRQTAVVLQKHE